MARRSRSSPAEGLIELIAVLPWWAGVVLAVLSYLLLHSIAAQPITAGPPGQVAAQVTQAMWKGLASAGQYVLPLLCLAAAAVSAWRRRVRQGLVTDVQQSQASNALDGLSWREFEMLVGEGFRLQGYQVSEVGGGGADGGVDLMLIRPGSNGTERFFVQCKQWRALKVGVDVVRELYGVMAARGATGGFVVTSGRFTEEAVRFASGRNVMLLDGPKLLSLIQQAKPHARGAQVRTGTRMATEPARASIQPPACPVCAKQMVRRTAKRGDQAGSAFWGCSGYPACRGTRPID